MTRPRHPVLCAATFTAGWRWRALLALLGLSLANPSDAQPFSMDELLKLPLHRLLLLQISPPRLPQSATHQESSMNLMPGGLERP